MFNIAKIIRAAKVKTSSFFLNRENRVVKHLKLGDFELLVFVNEDVGRLASVLGVYEPSETRFFKKTILVDDLCIDVGGNIGYFSMLMAKCAAQGSVHVFEPIPLNASMISTSSQLNGFSNVTVNNLALGSENGMVQFSISSDSAYSSMRATGTFQEARSVNVRLMTLDSYVEKEGLGKIDIMKVDVEGAEEMVLIGGAKLLSDPQKRPRLIMLELFDKNLEPYNTTVESIVTRMKNHGYAAYVLVDEERGLQSFTSDLANIHYNVFFQPL